MSATSILQTNYQNTRDRLDEVLMCMADKDLMFRKMGIETNLKSEDIDMFLFLEDILRNGFCDDLVTDECFLDKLNALYFKFV